MAAIGGASAFVGKFAAGVYNEMDKYRNVRDWQRGSNANNEGGAPGFWDNFIDSEEEQLIEELFGGQFGSTELDDGEIEQLNKSLGSNYTKDDVPRLKELAMATYKWMAGSENGIKGDDVMSHLKENNTINTSTGFSTDGGKDGREIQQALDLDMRRSDPRSDWVVHGVNTPGEMDDFVGEGGELWNGVEVTDVYPANSITNTPQMYGVKNKDGVRKVVESKEGPDLYEDANSGLIANTTKLLGMPEMQSEEIVRQQLNFIKKQNGIATVGDIY